MNDKKVEIGLILSLIVHAAFLSFLFSFNSSKPIPDSNTSVLLATLVNPTQKVSEPQQLPKPKSAQPQKTSPVQPQEIPQIPDQPLIPTEKTEYIEPQEEFQPTEESETSDISNESSDNFAESGATNTIASEYNSSSSSSPTDSPRALYMPKIPYPRAAKNAKIEGTAEITYTIDEKGRVTSVEVLSIPHISFESVIKRTVFSWRFSPATKNGKPISIKASKTIVFSLTE